MSIQLIANHPKTISMSQEQKDKWLIALRSGDYKQAHQTLYDETSGGYCCLGVLQKVISGDVSRHCNGTPEDVPSNTWLEENNIEFRSADNEYAGGNPGVTLFFPPNDGEMSGSSTTSIAELNDAGNDFVEIAEVLEQIIEVV